jgi:hypothetical protein
MTVYIVMKMPPDFFERAKWKPKLWHGTESLVAYHGIPKGHYVSPNKKPIIRQNDHDNQLDSNVLLPVKQV